MPHITHDNIMYDTFVGDAHMLHTRVVSAFGLLFEPFNVLWSGPTGCAKKKTSNAEFRPISDVEIPSRLRGGGLRCFYCITAYIRIISL